MRGVSGHQARSGTRRLTRKAAATGGLVEKTHLYERSLNELEHHFGTHAVKALFGSFCGQGRTRSVKYEEPASALLRIGS